MYTVNDNSLQSIADSIRKKAKTSEKMTFPAGFVSAIEGIETGGGSAPVVVEEPEEKAVNFYDYDGRRLFSYTAEEAATLTELPTPPARDGLVFQEWNWTLDEVKAARAADIGALYTTDDGKTRLYVKIDNQARKDLTLNLYQAKAEDISVDWGDGSAAETSASTMGFSLFHTYGSAGNYVITLTIKNKTAIGIKYGTAKQLLSGAGINPDSSVYASSLYTNSLIKVELGDNIDTIGEEAFYGCQNLESINIPNTMATIKAECFNDCQKLRWFSNMHAAFVYNFATRSSGLARATFGGGGTAYGTASAFNKCLNLRRAAYPSKYTAVGSNDFAGCSSLVEVVFNGNITKIDGAAFQNCYALKKLDFTNNTAVPSLASFTALSNVPKDVEILVPAALVDTWKAATNWVTYANNIKGV